MQSRPPIGGPPDVFLTTVQRVSGGDPERLPSTTRLRRVRLERGLSQRELAELTGIPLRSLERLDRGEVDDFSYRSVVNLCLALRCKASEIIEPDWFQWKDDLTPGRHTPVPREALSRGSRSGYQRARPRPADRG